MGLQKVSITSKSLKGFLRDRDKLNFEMAIQRKGDLWDSERQSLLVHSIGYGYGMPPMYSVEIDGSLYNMLDGKQRFTTLLNYIDNKFALHPNTPDIGDEEIAGKTFSELSKELQDEISSYVPTIYAFKSITEEEIEELFFRYNSPVPLSNMELIRAKAGTQVMSFIEEICKMPFMTTSINLTDLQRKRYTDQELIFQVLMLLIKDDVDFQGKHMLKVADCFRKEGIPEEIKNRVRQITEYLYQAIPENQKFLRKVHIASPIYYVADKAIQDNVEPEKLGGFLQWFFEKKNMPEDYKDTARGSSAKMDKVQGRIDQMLISFEENINSCGLYKSSAQPEPEIKKEWEGMIKQEGVA